MAKTYIMLDSRFAFGFREWICKRSKKGGRHA